MFKIDTADAVAVLPTPGAAGTPGYFSVGDPGTGALATEVTADWLNGVQGELMAVLAAASDAADKAQLGQVLFSLRKMFLGASVAVWTAAVSTTWTVPAGRRQAMAVAIGGGGGGSGNWIGSGASGAGGGAGGLFFGSVPLVAGDVMAVIVGAGGTAGANDVGTAGLGGTGGTTSFGALVSCLGGAGGQMTQRGLGGAASVAGGAVGLVLTGGPGGFSGGPASLIPGDGAAGLFGMGGGSAFNLSANCNAAGPGGGGGGLFDNTGIGGTGADGALFLFY